MVSNNRNNMHQLSQDPDHLQIGIYNCQQGDINTTDNETVTLWYSAIQSFYHSKLFIFKYF
jgi:hypothetical protein